MRRDGAVGAATNHPSRAILPRTVPALAQPLQASAPLDWLLDPADPSARLRTLVELLDRDESSPEVREAIDAVLSSPQVKAAFARQREDGSFGDLKGTDDERRGTAWTCAWLLQMGVPAREPRLVRAVRALVDARQMKESANDEHPAGAFSFSRKAVDVASCVTGDNLALCFAVLGPVEENRRAVHWLLRTQRHDGGWLHCHRWSWKAKAAALMSSKPAWPEQSDVSVRSCRFGTYQAMRGLAALPHELRDAHVRRALSRAAEYFLVRGVTGQLDAPKTDLVPSVRSFNAGLQNVGTVLRQNADMLAIARVLVELGYASDARLSATVQRIAQLQAPSGMWPALAASPGMLEQKVGAASRQVTIDALVLLRRWARSHGEELALTF